jgi:predicted acylesterase/phospholipase RssA
MNTGEELSFPDGGSKDHVDRRLAGVFEGGGAKGIAYEGALSALEQSGLWFTAVAGASAGAITAALIAAGCTAADIARLSSGAMQTLADELALPAALRHRLPFVWKRLSSLANRDTAAAATSDTLENWLRHLLAERIGVPDPSFADLYLFSGIELTIVAVDIHHRQHRVFTHTWSPAVSVASAAVASSSIPFALPPRRLLVASDDEYAAPIVDGGVWTNFPLFVFEDAEFRAYHGMMPMRDLDATIVGFLLDEAASEVTADDVRPARFVQLPHSMRDAAKSAQQGSTETKAIGPSELLLTFRRDEIREALGLDPKRKRSPWRDAGRDATLDSWLRTTSEVAGMRASKLSPQAREAAARDNKTPQPSTDRTVRKRALFTLVNGASLLAMAAYTVLMIVAALFVAATPTWLLLQRVNHGVWWTHVLWWFGLVIAVVIGLVSASVFLVMTTGNAMLYWPARRFGGLIASTYLAGSGAPYWAGRAPGVDGHVIIRLPIPPGLGTTSFAVSSERRQAVVAEAREATTRALDRLRTTNERRP